MNRVFIADTDRANIKMLYVFLALKHSLVSAVWQNSREYLKFLDESESAIVFIRMDNCNIPGLELTRAAIERGTGIRVVWMSESDAYALDAFRYGAEAYLLLPATEDTLDEVMKSLVLERDRKK